MDKTKPFWRRKSLPSFPLCTPTTPRREDSTHEKTRLFLYLKIASREKEPRVKVESEGVVLEWTTNAAGGPTPVTPNDDGVRDRGTTTAKSRRQVLKNRRRVRRRFRRTARQKHHHHTARQKHHHHRSGPREEDKSSSILWKERREEEMASSSKRRRRRRNHLKRRPMWRKRDG